MGTPTMMRKLGDKANSFASSMKSLPPGESEFQGLRAVQQNVDDASAADSQQPGQAQPMAQAQPMNSMARYGDRPGESRLDVDIDGNVVHHAGLKPIAQPATMQPVATAPVAKPGLKPIVPASLSQPMPLYDDGGDVKVEKQPDMTVTAGKEKPEEYISKYGEGAAVANRPDASKPAPGMKKMSLTGYEALPVYDDGGDVDVNDGKHQVAVLQDGEKVLTPEQAKQYDEEHKEEHGAPADFGGRILSNPKGLKPMLDTEAQSRVDEPTSDAKKDISNAPLTAPTGDISNAPLTTPEVTESSTKELKPYGEAKADKEKAKAKVDNPGAPTTTSEAPEEEVKPRGGTPQEQQAIDADIKAGMGKGVSGLTQIGLAKLHENMLAPAGLNQGAPAPDAMDPNAKSGLKPIAGVEGAPQAPPMDFKAKLADYDKRIQAALDEATPQGQEKAERLKEAKEELIHRTPWGSKDNHPGILGKIGHVAERVASRLPVIGQVVNQLPGSEGQRNAEHNETLGQLQKDTPLATAREAEQNAADKNSKDGKEWAPLPKSVLNPATGKYEEALYNKSNPDEIRFKGQSEGAEKPESGQENKNAFQATLAKIGTPEAADPGKQMQALKDAHDAKTITDDEYNKSIGYLGANPAPATQMASSTEKSEATQKAKRAGKWFTWTDDEGTHYGSGDKVPADAEASEVDGKTFMNEARTANIVTKSMNTIAKDVDEHPELFDNATARNILATTLEQIDRTSAGLLIAGTGGTIPLPSGMGDMINTALQNNALDKKSAEALKNYVADYKSMKDKVIVMQMEMQGGKIGRGSAQAFKAIADQLPNGATPDSKTAKRQMTNLYTTQQDLMSKFPERYQNYNKEKLYQFKGEGQPEASEQGNKEHQQFVQSINLPGGGHPADAAKGADGSTIYWSGKAGDPWRNLVTGAEVK